MPLRGTCDNKVRVNLGPSVLITISTALRLLQFRYLRVLLKAIARHKGLQMGSKRHAFRALRPVQLMPSATHPQPFIIGFTPAGDPTHGVPKPACSPIVFMCGCWAACMVKKGCLLFASGR